METNLPSFVNQYPPRYDSKEECERALLTGDCSKSYTPGTPEWEHARYEILLIKQDDLKLTINETATV
jgi:hypothetical protein